MRIKLECIDLALGETTLHLGYSGADKTVQWSFSKDQGTAGFQDSMAIAKLITPDSIDQLAYDLYKVLADLKNGPELVAGWDQLWMLNPTCEYNEFSRVRVSLDWIVKSYR